MPEQFHTADSVRELIKAACVGRGSQRQFAIRAGVSPAYLSSVISGRREPGESVLAALGLVRAVVYLPA